MLAPFIGFLLHSLSNEAGYPWVIVLPTFGTTRLPFIFCSMVFIKVAYRPQNKNGLLGEPVATGFKVRKCTTWAWTANRDSFQSHRSARR